MAYGLFSSLCLSIIPEYLENISPRSLSSGFSLNTQMMIIIIKVAVYALSNLLP